MSLPSQSTRSTNAGRSATVYRRRKKGARLIGVFVALGAIGLVLWVIVLAFTGGSSDTEAPTDANATLTANEDDKTSKQPTTPTLRPSNRSRQAESRPTYADPTPPPAGALVIDQGSGSDRSDDTSGETASTSKTNRPESNVDPMKQSPRSRLGDAITSRAETPTTAPTSPRTSRPSSPTSDRDLSPAQLAARALSTADTLMNRGDPLAARELLSVALGDASLPAIDRELIRAKLSSLNEQLVFGPTNISGDPLTETYAVETGDVLSKIVRKRELATHWRLIQRVNGLDNPNRIRVGQPLKLVRGPFHAIVHKSDYRLDLYHGPPDDESRWLFIRSFDVGLGELGSTPKGDFSVRVDSKLENPAWVNPRNPAERFDGDDKRNPIGEFWIGLDGIGEDAIYTGYGIHGTIEPDSIGKQESMGCVRLLPDDIALIYECLTEGISRVRITD